MVIEVVSRKMANIPIPEFQKLWSNLIESLKLEYENTVQQHPDSDAVVKRICGALTPIARLVECTRRVSQRTSEMDSNLPKRGENQEESQLTSERKATI
jgi:hypothetical protein